MNKLLLPMVLLLLAGCIREKGDRPLARGKGFGYEWTTANRGGVLRVSLQNSFTRDAYVALDGNGHHYELGAGPIRDSYMIVPRGDYEYSAWTFGRSIGETKAAYLANDRDGIHAVLVQVRP